MKKINKWRGLDVNQSDEHQNWLEPCLEAKSGSISSLILITVKSFKKIKKKIIYSHHQNVTCECVFVFKYIELGEIVSLKVQTRYLPIITCSSNRLKIQGSLRTKKIEFRRREGMKEGHLYVEKSRDSVFLCVDWSRVI